MDNQSNSRFYHGDCTCIKKQSISVIRIQCKNCIHNKSISGHYHGDDRECNCIEQDITHNICKICSELRDKIDTLYTNLDDMLYVVSKNIKEFTDCNEQLIQIQTISNELRCVNSKLLKNLIK